MQEERQPLSSRVMQARLRWHHCVCCCRRCRCRCVTTLQSNMLRQLVSSSLQDYLQLFRQHAVVHPLDPQQDTVLWSCLPMFETELVVQDGRY